MQIAEPGEASRGTLASVQGRARNASVTGPVTDTHAADVLGDRLRCDDLRAA